MWSDIDNETVLQEISCPRNLVRSVMLKATFRPHAIIVPERRSPNPIFIAALISVEKILRLDFDTSLPEHTYFHQALAKLPEQTIAFGKLIGLIINYAADRTVQFDLKGNAIEMLSEAVRFGEASFFIPPNEEDVSIEIGEALIAKNPLNTPS